MLYAMMGVAAGLVWDRIDEERDSKKALVFFCHSTGIKCFVVVFVFGFTIPC
jgi:tryptophan-rich sensory protein